MKWVDASSCNRVQIATFQARGSQKGAFVPTQGEQWELDLPNNEIGVSEAIVNEAGILHKTRDL